MAPTSRTMGRSSVWLIWSGTFVPDVLLEPRQLDRDRVGAGQEVVDLEQALIVGHHRDRRVSGRSVTVTVAPGIAPFVASVTRPVIRPRVSWAYRDAGRTRATSRRATAQRTNAAGVRFRSMSSSLLPKRIQINSVNRPLSREASMWPYHLAVQRVSSGRFNPVSSLVPIGVIRRQAASAPHNRRAKIQKTGRHKSNDTE